MHNWQPTLTGRKIQVRPLNREDFEPLFQAASDPAIWEQHSALDRYQRAPFQKFFSDALASGGALVVEELPSGRIIGSSRYYDRRESDQSIIVGYTFLTRDHWGDGTNSELKELMLTYAFQRAARVWFQVSHGNLRSQKALEKIGARYSHDEEVVVAGAPSSRRIYKLDRETWTLRKSS
jgi:RimJ/RimL family protein N-acetyltransferase